MTKLTEDLYFCRKIDARGLSAPARGYIHVYDHSFQTSFSLEPLGQFKPSLTWEGTYHLGHMTKIASMPIYGKKTFKNLLLQNQKSYYLET